MTKDCTDPKLSCQTPDTVRQSRIEADFSGGTITSNAGTRLANASPEAFRLRLLKIGARVRVSDRRIHVAMSSVASGTTQLYRQGRLCRRLEGVGALLKRRNRCNERATLPKGRFGLARRCRFLVREHPQTRFSGGNCRPLRRQCG